MDHAPAQMSRPATADPVPFGLGWVNRLIDQRALVTLTPRERHTARLAVGVLAVGSVLTTATAVILGPLQPGAVVIALGLGALVLLLLLYVVIRDPSTVPMAGHGALALNQAMTVVATIAGGGLIPSGLNPIWGLAAPMFAALLIGQRAGLFWSGVYLAQLAGIVVWSILDPQPVDASATVVAAANLLLFGLLLWVALHWFVEQRDLAEGLLQRERERAEDLLHSILPEQVARRLSAGERVADHHREVSVMFIDIVGFTTKCGELAPADLVGSLDRFFGEIDAVTARFDLEKIKTIGDCYMLASGAPRPRADHCEAMARAGLDLRERLQQLQFHDDPLQVRIGMATGPAVAGVIGSKRFLYDLWGDTVNLASRMESTGVPGSIQVTSDVRALLADRFHFVERGEIDVKGKGRIKTWFLEAAA